MVCVGCVKCGCWWVCCVYVVQSVVFVRYVVCGAVGVLCFMCGESCMRCVVVVSCIVQACLVTSVKSLQLLLKRALKSVGGILFCALSLFPPPSSLQSIHYIQCRQES